MKPENKGSHKSQKDDKHSHTGVNGAPKKGGAGAHAWGKDGEILDPETIRNDPEIGEN